MPDSDLDSGLNAALDSGPSLKLDVMPDSDLEPGLNVALDSGPSLKLDVMPDSDLEPGLNVALDSGPSLKLDVMPDSDLEPGLNVALDSGVNVDLGSSSDSGLDPSPFLEMSQGSLLRSHPYVRTLVLPVSGFPFHPVFQRGLVRFDMSPAGCLAHLRCLSHLEGSRTLCKLKT
ncbi:hypothetical protein B0T20DRAFT_509281 [Sordaria brevicollis]|uniref:Uncharacterized protein n=1 Tax=Sordaria brevicollis TaxID=83679 RepID=A0AAE0P8T7_SORBR|nr:hypothetical protein B0T20DRAFT_509281 [Sordaria brevicollis]